MGQRHRPQLLGRPALLPKTPTGGDRPRPALRSVDITFQHRRTAHLGIGRGNGHRRHHARRPALNARPLGAAWVYRNHGSTCV